MYISGALFRLGTQGGPHCSDFIAKPAVLAFPLGSQKCSVYTLVFQKAHHSLLHYSQAE